MTDAAGIRSQQGAKACRFVTIASHPEDKPRSQFGPHACRPGRRLRANLGRRAAFMWNSWRCGQSVAAVGPRIAATHSDQAAPDPDVPLPGATQHLP